MWWMMMMMVNFMWQLAPGEGAIIVGDAVVEIDTSLDEASGRVLAIGGEGVAPAQAEIGAWRAEVSAALVAQKLPIAVGNVLIEVQWGGVGVPAYSGATRWQSRPAQLLGRARCREVALHFNPLGEGGHMKNSILSQLIFFKVNARQIKSNQAQCYL